MNKHSNIFTQEDIAHISELLKNQQLPEPHLYLVKSVVHNGYRFRVIWNKIYPRPLRETFHGFIISILGETFGKKWHQKQMSLPEGERHIIIHWIESYSEWKKATHSDENKEDEYTWSAIPSGEVMALHSFAYDIYCLQIVNKLPSFLIKRLRNKNEFQGARYEVAVAAIIARAGFNITFLDNKIKDQKHCEFIAKNKYSGEEIGVEAKSRRRKGVLHEEGELNYSSVVRGDVKGLFKKACLQKPNNMPYFIFIDLNVMPTPEIPFNKKPWLEDMKLILDEYGTPSKGNPDSFNVLVFTNFSYYYGGNTKIAPPGEYGFVISPFPEYQCKDGQPISEILKSLERYSDIPKEI